MSDGEPMPFTNQSCHERALRLMPGGVNSPVRAFKAVGGVPRTISRALGARIWDVEEREYLDYIGSWGPMILGHGHPAVVEAVQRQAVLGMSYGAPSMLESDLAEAVCARMPHVEMVRMVNSGTEATMSAIRLARAFTKRDFVIKFEGCYHGHGDAFLSKAGSGAATLGVPTSPGVPKAAAAATLNARYNDLESVRELCEAHPEQVACIIVEPVVGNMGCVPPQEGFLAGLRSLCDQHGALLIFDEVMTGFRLSPGGAQQLFDIRPDLTTLGKIVGGGLPVGAYGGRRDIMELVAPSGPMYQAGTLSGNPLGMAAGLTTLKILAQRPQIYEELEEKGCALETTLRAHIQAKGYPACFQRVGSMATLFFGPGPVRSWDEAAQADTKLYGTYFWRLLEQGIFMPPAQFEAFFWSGAHQKEDIGFTIAQMRLALDFAFDRSVAS